MNNLSFGLEVKALKDREFEGHGSIFSNVDLGDDVVLPGAFKKSLAQHKKNGTTPLMFWMHDPEQVPGVWKEVREDERGLFVKGELVETQLGNEMHVLLQKQAVRGLSIGFRIEDFEFDADGVRKLKQIDLWEVSIVSMAMNPIARVESVKARLSATGEYVPTPREFERILRDVGVSQRARKTMISRIFDNEPNGMLGPPPAGVETELAAMAKHVASLQEAVQSGTVSAWAKRFARA